MKLVDRVLLALQVPDVLPLSTGVDPGGAVAVSGEVWNRLGDNEVLQDPTNVGVDASSKSLHREAHARIPRLWRRQAGRM